MAAIKETQRTRGSLESVSLTCFFYTVCVQSSLYNEEKNTLVRKEEFMVKQYVSFR
jgi:hypothetical protein